MRRISGSTGREDRDRAMQAVSLAGAGISRELVRQAGQREDRVARQGTGRRRPRSCRSPPILLVAAPAPPPRCAVAGTRDADIDSARRAARHRPRHARARPGGGLSRRAARRSGARVLRSEERAADAGADGQGAHLRQRRRQQDSRRPPSRQHRARRPRSRGRLEVQRLHALQPVPPGDRRRARRRAGPASRRTVDCSAPLRHRCRRQPPSSCSRPRFAPAAPIIPIVETPRHRPPSRPLPAPPSPPHAAVSAGTVADHSGGERRRRILDRAPARTERVAHRHRSRPRRPRSRHDRRRA